MRDGRMHRLRHVCMRQRVDSNREKIGERGCIDDSLLNGTNWRVEWLFRHVQPRRRRGRERMVEVDGTQLVITDQLAHAFSRVWP